MIPKTIIRDIDRLFRRNLVPFGRAARDSLLLALRGVEGKEQRLQVIDAWERQWAAQAASVGNVSLSRQYRVLQNQAGKELQKIGIEPPPGRNPSLGQRESLVTLRQSYVASVATQSRELVELEAGPGAFRGVAKAGVRTLDKRARRFASRAAHVAATSIATQMYQDAGLEKFIWVTAGDSKVRADHRELDGKVFSLAKGAPGVGRPGQPHGCRCRALPFRGRNPR